eukprot:3121292-Rhodomonas_salina.2
MNSQFGGAWGNEERVFFNKPGVDVSLEVFIDEQGWHLLLDDREMWLYQHRAPWAPGQQILHTSVGVTEVLTDEGLNCIDINECYNEHGTQNNCDVRFLHLRCLSMHCSDKLLARSCNSVGFA